MDPSLGVFGAKRVLRDPSRQPSRLPAPGDLAQARVPPEPATTKISEGTAVGDRGGSVVFQERTVFRELVSDAVLVPSGEAADKRRHPYLSLRVSPRAPNFSQQNPVNFQRALLLESGGLPGPASWQRHGVTRGASQRSTSKSTTFGRSLRSAYARAAPNQGAASTQDSARPVERRAGARNRALSWTALPLGTAVGMRTIHDPTCRLASATGHAPEAIWKLARRPFDFQWDGLAAPQHDDAICQA